MSITESFLCIPFPMAYTSPGRDPSWRKCRGSMRTEAAGNTLPPEDEDVRTRRLTVILKTSWAWSLQPSPPHLPAWHCHVKIRSGLEGCWLGSQRGTE